ncbi:MAG: LysR substrate-binding domain-containing protein [Nesterenkonia sp.]
MELRHLRYFVAVAQERHFGNAARRLNMAQPPLSQQIKAFEAQLGVTLLQRTTRSVSLTPAGQVLLDRAHVLLAELDTLEDEVRRVDAGAQGILRLGSTGSAAYHVLPRLLRQARRQIPGLELDVRGELLNPELVEGLRGHRIDAALLRMSAPAAGLTLENVQSDELRIALPEDHALVGKGDVDPAELRDEPLVSYPSDSAVALLTAQVCRAAGFEPKVRQVLRETSTLISLVAGGGFAAFVPEPVSALGMPGVVFLPLVGRPTVDLAMAWRSDDHRPLLHALIELVRADVAPPTLTDEDP